MGEMVFTDVEVLSQGLYIYIEREKLFVLGKLRETFDKFEEHSSYSPLRRLHIAR